MILNAEQLDSLSSALRQMTRMTAETGVRVGAYGSFDVEVQGVGQGIRVNWSHEDKQYVFDEQVGC